MIHVVAVITAKPGQREAILAEARANLPAVRAEAGCIAYQPVIDAPEGGEMQTRLGDDTFMVIEIWESEAALAAHAASPHMAAYARKTRDMVASRAVHVLTPAAG
jgi:quinol monooxygenase YgiN